MNKKPVEFQKIKRYFDYSEKSSKVVSIVTAVLIVLYNIFSGIFIVYFFNELIFKIHFHFVITAVIYLSAGILIAGLLLKLSIFLINLLLGNIEIENYSYIRLILLISIVLYLLLLFTYSILFISKTLGISTLQNIFRYSNRL